MIYVKSFLAGLLALVLAVLILVGLAFAAVQIRMRTNPEGGMFLVMFHGFRQWLVVLVAFAIFASGFYLEFRRARGQ